MKLCTKADLNWLTAMMLDSDIFGASFEDGMTKKNTRSYVQHILKHSNIHVVSCVRGKMIHSFHLHNQVMAEIHTAIRRGSGLTGKEKVRLSREAVVFMANRFGIRKIITHVPEGNRAAALYARMCGLERVGVLTNSLKRNGRLLDMALYQSNDDDLNSMIRRQ